MIIGLDEVPFVHEEARDLFHDIGSNVYSLLSSHLISQLEKHLLEFSWEDAFLQLEVENESELVAASLVTCHQWPSSSKGKI